MILSKKKKWKRLYYKLQFKYWTKEARLLGFINQNGDSHILEKELDVENHILIVRLKKE